MTSNDNFTYKDAVLEIPKWFEPGWFKLVLHSFNIKSNKFVIKFIPCTEKDDIIVDICTNVPEFRNKIREKLLERELDDKDILSSIYKTLNSNSEKFLPISMGKTHKEKETKLNSPIFTYKFTREQKLYESIIINGNSHFISVDNLQLELTGELDSDSEHPIRPMPFSDYPYPPYVFENKEEIERYISLIHSKRITIEKLFALIRAEIEKFIVHHDFVLDFITALIIFSYFQDSFSTVPYTLFVSDNGNGKTVVGNFFEMLAYRVVNMTDPTTANIFRVFGTLQAGQCSLVMDEAEKIDTNDDMMSILKNGYENGKLVQRIDLSGIQRHYHTFGVKIMAAERIPNPVIAKGVLDRTFIISNFKGKPQLDIKEVKNVRNSRNLRIKKMLMEVRKILLIYRLVNFGSTFPDIEIGLDGRSKELCKPILQIFYKTNLQERIENVMERLIKEKLKRKENSIETPLLEVVLDLFNKYENGVFPFVEIWEMFIKKVDGKLNFSNPTEFDSDLYGKVHKKRISHILRNKFGATDPPVRNSKITYLYFESREKIQLFLNDYRNLPIKIKCIEKTNESNESNEFDIEKMF